MQISNLSQQFYGTAAYKKQDNADIRQNTGNQETPVKDPKTTHVEMTSETIEMSCGHDFTRMTSGDMLSLANTFHKQGNIQDFLSLAVFSARAALEDHPDPLVRHTWSTPRNEDSTFNLLAEIKAPISSSTGSPALDMEQQEDRAHLLQTLLSIPSITARIEKTSIDITQ